MIALLPLLATLATPAAVEDKAAVLTRDTRGRPTIAVRIDDGPPIDMVVDTAAGATLISARAAERIGLAPSGDTVVVAGATGVASAPLYRIKRFASPLFDRRDIDLVALPNGGTTDAGGIVEIDAFRGRKLVFDRIAARLGAVPSAPAPAGYATVAGRLDPEGFVTVPVTLDGVAMPAVIDTGAAVTIVNPAGLRRLGIADGDPRLTQGGEVRGATATTQQVRMLMASRLRVGAVALGNVPIIVSDAANGPDPAQPSMILGDDILNLFEAYAVDLNRAELQIRLPTHQSPEH